LPDVHAVIRRTAVFASAVMRTDSMLAHLRGFESASISVRRYCYVQDDADDVCEQLLNQLVLLQLPGFVYAAKPPEGAGRAGRRTRQRRTGAAAAAAAGGLDDDDDESATVYGSYAAVTLCDGRCVQHVDALVLEQQMLNGEHY
jgi:hypothetical protein